MEAEPLWLSTEQRRQQRREQWCRDDHCALEPRLQRLIGAQDRSECGALLVAFGVVSARLQVTNRAIDQAVGVVTDRAGRGEKGQREQTGEEGTPQNNDAVE